MANVQAARHFIEAITIVFLSPLPVYAHHCSSLSDCWSTAAASAAAALGAALVAAIIALFQSITGVPQDPELTSPRTGDQSIIDDP
jgi:hypothetical protein